MAGKDANYFAKRGYLGREGVIQANTPQPAANMQVQENLSEVAAQFGGPGAGAPPVQIQRQTVREADERNQTAASRIQQQLDAGQISPEQAAQFRSRLGLDE